MIKLSQLSFTGGIWSPSLYSRSDLQKYNTAVRKMKNMFPYIYGGVSNRGGTQFLNEVKDSSKKTILIPFQFSILQAYILEFGDKYIRVYKDGELVVNSAGTGLDIVEAGTYKWLASAHGTNEYYLDLNAGGDPDVDDPIYVFEGVGGANTSLVRGTLGSLTAGQYAYGDNDALGYSTIYVRLTDNVDPDGKADGYLEASYIYEIETDYEEVDLAKIKFAQTADVMYLCHPSYPMAKLTRTAHDVWTLDDVTYDTILPAPTVSVVGGAGTTLGYVVCAAVSSTTSWLMSDASNRVVADTADVLSWSGVEGATHYEIFRESALNEGIYYNIGLVEDSGGATTTYTIPASVSLNLDFTAITENLTFDTADNYPGCCAFYEQRLILMRTNNYPQTVFGSRSGDYESMGYSSVIQDDDSFEFTIYSNQMKEIRWAIGIGDYLLLGTSDAEYFLSPGTGSDYVTPSNVKIKPQSGWGVSDILPLKIGNAVLFLEGSGRVVRDYAYSFDIDGYKGSDVSVFANHLFEGRSVVSWCYQKSPYSIVWCVLDDGSLIGLTYDREQQVWGWHQHETQGFFEHVTCLAEGAGTDNVYAIVKRLIDGEYVRYIEVFKNRLPEDSVGEYDIKNAFFVDCGLSWDNPLSITDIDLDEEITVTVSNHGLSNADTIDISELDLAYDLDGELEFGTDELNGNRYIVSDATTHTFKLKDSDGEYIDGTEMTAYLSGGKVRKAVMTLSGLDHLEGKSVAILADGNVVRNKTVTSGAVSLPFRASRIHIGLGYHCEVETLDFDIALKDGPLKAKVRNIPLIQLQLRNTRQVFLGPSSDRSTSEVIFRTEGDGENAVQLFSGVKEAALEASSDGAGRVYAKVVDPLPLTIDGLVVSVDYDNY